MRMSWTILTIGDPQRTKSSVIGSVGTLGLYMSMSCPVPVVFFIDFKVAC